MARGTEQPATITYNVPRQQDRPSEANMKRRKKFATI